MGYAILKVPKENMGMAKKILAEDEISRQSIVTRDMGAIGFEGDGMFVLLEGDDKVIKKAVELIMSDNLGEELTGEEKEKVYRAIKDQEESASIGMGAIFG